MENVQKMNNQDGNLFLIGFMGTGKSTIARELKETLQMECVEMDQLIEKRQNMSISNIFDEYGETYFRNLESNLLMELQKRKQTIVSCGGGVVMRPENVEYMKRSGCVVLLTATPATIYERVKSSTNRPILHDNMNVEFISKLLEKRREKYEAAADITVATDGKNVTQICEEIMEKWMTFDRKKEEYEEKEMDRRNGKMEQRISGHTGLLALIGSPVAHSGSPAMYNFSFRHDGLDYAYMAFDITQEQVPAALDAVRLFQMRGCNVTMPCKNEAAKYVDELSPAARIIGAVNTIVNEDGKLIGHMTDGTGFVRNLKEHGVDVKGKKVVVLGAGGAATAISVQCALDGAKEVVIFNGADAFFERAMETKEKLKTEVSNCVVKVCHLEKEEELAGEIATADILVNGTKAGMKPNDGISLVKPEFLRKELIVADVVYNPEKTKLLIDAEAAGCQAIGGKGMLLWQGAAAYKLYTGKEMPVAEYQKFQKEFEKNSGNDK